MGKECMYTSPYPRYRTGCIIIQDFYVRITRVYCLSVCLSYMHHIQVPQLPITDQAHSTSLVTTYTLPRSGPLITDSVCMYCCFVTLFARGRSHHSCL